MAENPVQLGGKSKVGYRVTAIGADSPEVIELISGAHAKALSMVDTQKKNPKRHVAKTKEESGSADSSGPTGDTQQSSTGDN